MPYQVLALKWRPQVFEDVVGQSSVTRTLKNAIQQGRIAHAFLFSGVRGVGKTTTARILAKALNCTSEDGPTVHPCGECPSCKEIAASRSLDVLEIDGASHTKVEEIRDVLEASQYAPSRDRFKIYVIDEVHMLSTHSFNALLKTLEEPPPHLKFIFATTEYHKIPDTIVSRCQQFEFRTVSTGDIAAQLRRIAEAEKMEVSDAAIGQIARAAEGSIRDALSALDQVVAATGATIDEEDVTELLGLIASDVLKNATRAIVERDTAAILGIVDELVRGGRDLQSFSRGLMQFFRDVLVVRVAPDSSDRVEVAHDSTDLSELAERLSEEDLIRSLEILTRLESALRWSPEPRFHLEVALLKLAELRRLASFEDLLARFEALESGRRSPKGPAGGGGGGYTGERPSRGPGKSRAPSDEKPTLSRSMKAESAATEPQSGPVMPPDATATVTTSDAVMDKILERLRSAKPKLAALVSHHNGVTLEKDCLKLGFEADQPFLCEQIEQADFRRLLEEEASAVAGRKLKVEVRLSKPDKSEVETSQGDETKARRELFERAMKDPMVRGFKETFQGEVEDVRPLAPETEPKLGTTKR
jgi:DNA polymerase-3 subunit gamma/tau